MFVEVAVPDLLYAGSATGVKVTIFNYNFQMKAVSISHFYVPIRNLLFIF